MSISALPVKINFSPPLPIQSLTVPVLQAALAAQERWQLSYWDAAIIEAARASGCPEVLSEELSHGQDYGGVRVTSPFL